MGAGTRRSWRARERSGISFLNRRNTGPSSGCARCRTGLPTPTGSDPVAMSFGQGQIPFGPAAGNVFDKPSELNLAVPLGLNQDINVPWSPQPASSPQSPRPTIGWDETFPPAYRSLGLAGISSSGNSGVGRDPEASYPWPPGDAAPGKLGAYRAVG